MRMNLTTRRMSCELGHRIHSTRMTRDDPNACRLCGLMIDHLPQRPMITSPEIEYRFHPLNVDTLSAIASMIEWQFST